MSEVDDLIAAAGDLTISGQERLAAEVVRLRARVELAEEALNEIDAKPYRAEEITAKFRADSLARRRGGTMS